MLSDTPPLVAKEPVDIRMVRGLLHLWPFARGKGALARALSPLWHRREFLLSVEPGVFVPAELDDYMVYWVFVNGYDRDAVVRLSRELIGPGDTVLDVGANIGLWAMGAARRAGPTGVVHAVEPVPENYARLVSNLKLNDLGRVHAAPIAFSNRCGRVTMFRPRYGNSGHPSLGCRDGVDEPFQIDATTLDQYCELADIEKVDFIKIDVEGAELLVLEGAPRVLSSNEAPAILFEVNEDTAAKLKASTADAKKLLRSTGYELFRLEGGMLHAVDSGRREQPGDLFAFQPHHYRRFPWLEKLGAGCTV